MRPGPARILKCPYCGKEKKVMSLMSGNTFYEKLWSDNKRIAPMQPVLSFVQKCPSCNFYYLLNRQDFVYAQKDDWSLECGTLSFHDLCLALSYFENTIGQEDEIRIRIMILHAYNDYYRNSKENKIAEDKIAFEQNIVELLQRIDWEHDNMLFKAELHRELGQYADAIAVLSNLIEQTGITDARVKILAKAQSQESTVFLLNPENENRLLMPENGQTPVPKHKFVRLRKYIHEIRRIISKL